MHLGTSQWLSNDVIALCAHAIVFNRRAAAVFLRRWKPIHNPGDNKLTQVICETGTQMTDCHCWGDLFFLTKALLFSILWCFYSLTIVPL